jgi:hypothetical protein
MGAPNFSTPYIIKASPKIAVETDGAKVKVLSEYGELFSLSIDSARLLAISLCNAANEAEDSQDAQA